MPPSDSAALHFVKTAETGGEASRFALAKPAKRLAPQTSPCFLSCQYLMNASPVVMTISIATLVLLISTCSKGFSAEAKSEAATPGTGPIAEQKTPASWTNDWSAFVNELSKEYARAKSGVTNVGEAFNGKTVEWTGKVTWISRPAKGERMPAIDVFMKPETLVFDKSYSLAGVHVSPTPDEWETWKSVSVGDTVVFRTTLVPGGLALPATMIVIGQQSGPDRELIQISTKGASCLKIQEH